MDTFRIQMKRARLNTPLKQLLDTEGRRQSWLAGRLSEALGREIDPKQVWGWVNGLHIPEPETREAIAAIISRPADELWPHPEERAA